MRIASDVERRKKKARQESRYDPRSDNDREIRNRNKLRRSSRELSRYRAREKTRPRNFHPPYLLAEWNLGSIYGRCSHFLRFYAESGRDVVGDNKRAI